MDPDVLADGITRPSDLVLDDQRLYWLTSPAPDGVTAPVPGKLQSVALDGGDVVTLVDSTFEPGPMAIAGEKLYWLDSTQSLDTELMTVNVDGSGATALVAGFHDVATAGTRLVLFDGLLYWGGAYGIHRVPLDGGAGHALLGLPDGGPYVTFRPEVVSIDSTGIYWSFGGYQLARTSLDGGTTLPLVTSSILSAGNSYAVRGGRAYWFEAGLNFNTLFDVSIDGPPPDGG